MDKDWNLKFTKAFHTGEIQKIVNIMFQNKSRMKISKEEFEQICSLIMKEVYQEE